jgi:hypothetical protein
VRRPPGELALHHFALHHSALHCAALRCTARLCPAGGELRSTGEPQADAACPVQKKILQEELGEGGGGGGRQGQQDRGQELGAGRGGGRLTRAAGSMLGLCRRSVGGV